MPITSAVQNEIVIEKNSRSSPLQTSRVGVVGRRPMQLPPGPRQTIHCLPERMKTLPMVFSDLCCALPGMETGWSDDMKNSTVSPLMSWTSETGGFAPQPHIFYGHVTLYAGQQQQQGANRGRRVTRSGRVVIGNDYTHLQCGWRWMARLGPRSKVSGRRLRSVAIIHG